MSHDQGLSCKCSVNHQPGILELTIHHVWPMGDGGPNDPANEVAVCPTTHYNVHEMYRAMKKAGREISIREFSAIYEASVSRYARDLAALGYRRFTAKAMVN